MTKTTGETISFIRDITIPPEIKRFEIVSQLLFSISKTEPQIICDSILSLFSNSDPYIIFNIVCHFFNHNKVFIPRFCALYQLLLRQIPFPNERKQSIFQQKIILSFSIFHRCDAIYYF